MALAASAAGVYSAGTAFLQVVPSFRHIEDAFKDDLRKMGAKLDAEIDKGVTSGMAKGSRNAEPIGKKVAQDFTGAFNRDVSRSLDKTIKAIPQKTGDALRGGWTKSFEKIRTDLVELQKEKVGFSIDENTFAKSVENMRNRLLTLENTAPRSADFHNASEARRNLDQVLGTLEQARRRGAAQAEVFSSAFEENIGRGLTRGLESIKPVEVDLDTTDAQVELQLLRIEMQDLADKKIGVDLNASEAFAKLSKIEAQLRTLAHRDIEVDVKYDAAAAADSLAKILAQSEKLSAGANVFGGGGGTQIAGLADQYANIFGSRFTDGLKEAVESGIRAIKPIKIEADTSEAQQTLQEIRIRLENLGNVEVGVHVTAAQANAELEAIRALADSLDNDDVEIDVRVDARYASAAMQKFRESTKDAEKEMSNLEKTASLTMSRLQYLIALGASIGSVFVPAVAGAAASLGFLGTSAIAAASGVGVLSLGLYGVGDALSAMGKYQDDQLKTNKTTDASNRRVAGSTDALANALRSLANTRRQVAEGAEDANRAIGEAELQVSRARHDAQIGARDSARSQADAQRDLTRAEADAKDVRKELNKAIEQAKKDMVDLRVELDRNTQDQNKAVTEQMAALNELHALQANPRASEVELRRARDNVNEQTVRLEELAKKRREMLAQQDEQAKKGVEGDTKVIAARKKIADADERVADARVKVQRAKEDADEKALQSAEKIRDAEKKVGDAVRARDRQRIDGAYQIASAQAAVAAATRSAGGAATKAADTSSAALDNLNIAMGKLTPTQQQFVRFLFGLQDELDVLRAAAADPMLPGLQKAIEMLLPYLPGVAKFIGKIAGQLGSMAVQAAAALQGPVWQRFFSYVDDTAVPAMQIWFDITKNLMDGLLNLYLALTPFDGQIGRGLVNLSEDFAQWAAALDKSTGYQEFLEYVRENGPRVLHFLGELGLLGLKLLEAYAPIGTLMLRVLTVIADGLNSIPMPVLTVLVGLIATLSLGISTLGAVLRAAKFKQQIGEIFGDSARQAVQKYAIDTGRATSETGKFKTAVSTVAGAATSVRERIAALPVNIVNAFGDKHQQMVQKFGVQTGRVSENAGALKRNWGTAMGAISAGMGTIGTATSKMGGLKGAFTSLGGFLGGPWGILLTAATVAITYFTSKSAEQKAKVETLRNALSQLSDKYTELARNGQQAGAQADEAFKQIVRSNPDMQKTVVTLGNLGISFDQMMNSLTSGDPSAVVNALNAEMQRLDDEMRTPGNFFQIFDNQDRADRIDELDAMKDAFLQNARAMGLGAQAEQILNAADARNVAVTKIKNAHQKDSAAVVDQLIGKYDEYGRKIDHLNAFINAFSTGSGNATGKAQALRDVIDDQTGAITAATDAADDYQRKLLDLKDAISQNGTAFEGNSRAALGNRDAVKQAATAAREMYIQDVAAGKPMSEVTKKHNERIKALIDEAVKGGLNRTAVEKLVTQYGKVPKNVETALATKNFNAVYKEMQKMRFLQYMLEQGKSASEAEKGWKDELKAAQTAVNLGGSGMIIPGKATGGAINGPGTGTSDSVLIRASDGEHMLTAEEVRKAGGHQPIYAFRRLLAQGFDLKSVLPGFATGGAVQRSKATWPYDVNAKAKILSRDEILAGIEDGGGPGGTGPLGNKGGGIGWRWQMAVLRAVFPGLQLYSGYRHSYTANGSLSWHGRDGGRAVDVPPRHDVFNFIHDNYGKKTKELIWLGDKYRNIHNGQHHVYDAKLLSQHGVAGMPNAHLHWAYDQGGYLQPGVQQVVNATGKPEPVLTAPQWSAVEQQSDVMRQLVSQANTLGGGNTYNYEFRDTTLDAAWVRAQQQRDDAMARVGRAR